MLSPRQKRRAVAATLVGLLAVVPAVAYAQSTSDESSRATRALRFIVGAATGLIVHEAGHVATGLALGAHPRAKSISFGPLPFVAIAHDPVSRREEYVIASAGFWAQHMSSEWTLSSRPNLRSERSPFRKGLLAFHLAASAVYTAAAVGRIGPPERDTLSMARSLGRKGLDEPVAALLVLVPAALDAYRYLRPASPWAPWAARAAKIGVVALVAAAGR